jgi:CcmD family protein
MPALPLDEAGKYVAGAYVAFFTLIVIYVAIIGAKIARIDRELEELNELIDEREGGRTPARSLPAGGPAPTSERGAGSPAEVTK